MGGITVRSMRSAEDGEGISTCMPVRGGVEDFPQKIQKSPISKPKQEEQITVSTQSILPEFRNSGRSIRPGRL